MQPEKARHDGELGRQVSSPPRARRAPCRRSRITSASSGTRACVALSPPTLPRAVPAWILLRKRPWRGLRLRPETRSSALAAALVRFGLEPRRKHGTDLRPRQEILLPRGIVGAYDEHPTSIKRVLVEETGLALQIGVGGHHYAVEGGTRGPNPLAALDDGERALRLERPAEALRREHQHLTGQRNSKRCEAGADGAVGKGLIPDLVLKIIVEMLRILLSVHQRHRRPQYVSTRVSSDMMLCSMAATPIRPSHFGIRSGHGAALADLREDCQDRELAVPGHHVLQ